MNYNRFELKTHHFLLVVVSDHGLALIYIRRKSHLQKSLGKSKTSLSIESKILSLVHFNKSKIKMIMEIRTL